MKKLIYTIVLILTAGMCGCSTMDMTRATSAGVKALQAATISDEYIEQYVSEYIIATDAQHNIASGKDPYAVRLNRIAGSFNNTGGLNIKVYKVKDVNAFACADGSIRVFSGLMDIMSDEEVLGVIGHEIGHIKLKHTKEAFKRALLTSALRDGISSAGGVAAMLSDSQVGALGESLMSAQYSQKHEFEADNYGYDFLKKHGINPVAMALSFDKLRQMQESGGYSGAVMQLFSTHPNIEARIKKMTERATKEGFMSDGKSTKTKPSSTKTPSTDSKWAF